MSSATYDVAPLRAVIKQGDVFVPGDDGYDASLQRWSATCLKPAAIVVRPTSAEETSQAVRFATANKIPLVVRGGGHSTSSSSASDGGLVIDLSHLRSVHVDPAAKTVTFGGGCRWVDVDNAAAKYGLATIGGTVNDTGVGGMILGGGYGFLTPKHGMAVDNLFSATVVLADGSIVTASETENPDLFWALRGAGQSFGVVVSFTSRVWEQGPVWGGMLALPYDKLPEIVAFANLIHEQQTGDDVMAFALTCMPAPSGELAPAVICIVFHDGPQAEAKKTFAPLLALPVLMNAAHERPYPTMNALMDGQPSPPRKLMGGANFTAPLTVEYVQSVTDDFIPATQELGVQPGSLLVFEIMPNRKILEVPSNATSFSARRPMYQMAMTYQWADAALDDKVRAFNREFTAKVKARGLDSGRGVGQYNNYEGGEGDHLSPETAFGDNLARLQELKKKYDPDNVFWKWHFIFPKA